MKYAFFLGAGASCSCGAPAQGQMLKEYFKLRQERNNPFDFTYFEDGDIYTFLQQFFGFDTEHDDINTIKFPTFEEIFGLIDVAISRKETFPNFEEGNLNLGGYNRLSACRDRFVGLMALILREKLYNVGHNHIQLVDKLRNMDVLKDTLFLSTNYDIIIDNAIIDSFGNLQAADYGFEFINGVSQDSPPFKVPLFKLHGSLNWLYCPTCKTMQLTAGEKGAVVYFDLSEPAILECQKCKSIKQPVIIPPTYFKEYGNCFLNQVWYKAEQALKNIETIFFCGYSFPDADIHIKSLLKRAEVIGGRLKKVIVCNNHDKKLPEDMDAERSRYERFFRRGIVDYTAMSFDYLIENLDLLIQ